MMGSIMWVVTALSVIGVVLNTYKRRECFLIWIGTNTTWMVYDWCIGAKAQAAMFAVYLALSIWGLWKWRETRPGRS